MTKNPFDQFAKQFFEAFLSPYGEVKLNYEIPGEPRFVDVLFAPSSQSSIPESLGLLRRVASNPCLIEPFRNQPTYEEIRSCIYKLLHVHFNFQRIARSDEEKLSEDELIQLWIITPSVSENLLNYSTAALREDWISGIYFLSGILKTAIIAVNDLPRTPETTLFRLFGRGRVQNQAVEEILALPKDDNRRALALQILSTWKISIELIQQAEETDTEDEDLIMILSEAYREWEEKTERRGKEQGIEQGLVLGQRIVVENLLKARFGEVDSELDNIIPSLLALPTEEYTSLLLQLSGMSREELIARFQSA